MIRLGCFGDNIVAHLQCYVSIRIYDAVSWTNVQWYKTVTWLLSDELIFNLRPMYKPNLFIKLNSQLTTRNVAR